MHLNIFISALKYISLSCLIWWAGSSLDTSFILIYNIRRSSYLVFKRPKRSHLRGKSPPTVWWRKKKISGTRDSSIDPPSDLFIWLQSHSAHTARLHRFFSNRLQPHCFTITSNEIKPQCRIRWRAASESLCCSVGGQEKGKLPQLPQVTYFFLQESMKEEINHSVIISTIPRFTEKLKFFKTSVKICKFRAYIEFLVSDFSKETSQLLWFINGF